MTSNHFLRLLNTAQPGHGESQARAGGNSASGDSESQDGGDQAIELGIKNDSGKKFTWLQKFMLRFRRRRRA